jgi:ABC-type multidrug transport system fused ATPase/permease subunit
MNPVRAIRNLFRGVSTILKLGFSAAPGRSSAALIATVSSAGLSLVASYMIKFVVQAAAAGRVTGALEAAILLALAAGAVRIAFLYRASLAPKLIELVTLRLDSELIRLTTGIATLEHQDRPAYADKISLVRSSRQQLANATQSVVINLHSLVMAAGVLGILVSIDARFVFLPLFAIPRALAGARARKLTRQSQEANAEPSRLRAHIYGKVASAAAGKEIRVFGLEQELLSRFQALTLQIRRNRDRANWGGMLWFSLGDFIFMTGCVGAIGWVVIRAARGEVSLGDVALTATMAATIVGLVTSVLQYGQSLQATLLTVERFHWLEDFAAESRSKPTRDARPPAALWRGVAFEGVSFAYPDREKRALNDISLDLPAGRVIALVGENGSGKSTLVKLLCGFYRPTSGRIMIDDDDLADMRVDDWRARVSAAFQDYTSFEFLLHESVGVGEVAHLGRKDRVAASLVRAGGADLIELKPKGLETSLGRKWGGVELSGGQWQKLALARAVFREHPLLVVFDEPTAALDAAAEQDMFATFAAEARSGDAAGRVTLLVSHRFSTVRMADAIAVLDRGRLVEFGHHRELMANGKLYAELFDLQARAYR